MAKLLFSKPQAIHYEAILDTLTKPSISLPHLNQTHALVITTGFSSKSVLACKLITSYLSLSGLFVGQKVFDSLPKRTSHAYNHMLSAYIAEMKYRSALGLYSHMLFSACQVSPDAVTFSLVAKASVALKSLRAGKLVHAHVVLTGSMHDLRLATDLLHLYGKCGCLDHAVRLFGLMPQKDAFAWTAMIDGYLRSRSFAQALDCFRGMRKSGLTGNSIAWNVLITGFARDGLVSDALCQLHRMQEDGVRPDKVSLCSILPMFAQYAILKPGLEAHGYVVRNRLEMDLFIVSALVDMYSKCGKLELARRVFDRVDVRDPGLWNALIVAYGMHGNCKEALSLFHQMRDEGVRPNEITFTSVLSACSHGGMIIEGQSVYDLMLSDYNVMVRHEHCACMVDMFGRAGYLDEAFAFINSMPAEPTRDIWGTFLSACRVHSNDKFAEVAARNIMGFDSASAEAGYHVVMSNVFAESRRWGDVAKWRTQIRDAGLKKRMGCSWIEVEGAIHSFCMADESHARSDEVYALLSHLNAAISGHMISECELL